MTTLSIKEITTTDIILLILTIMFFIIMCVSTYIFFVKQKGNHSQESGEKDPRISEIQEAIRNMSEDKLKNINEKSISMEALIKNTGSGFDEFRKTITEIKQQISDSLPTINQKTDSLKNINDAVEKLSNIFLSKSKRGSFGETQLNTILNDVLGSNEKIWKAQYTIGENNDRRVDAIIFLENDHKIAIDSKFPLENFNAYMAADNDGEKAMKLKIFREDIKKRISEVEKYFDKKENINNVIMFLPSEAIFITLCHDFPDVFEYARGKNITIATPTTVALIAFTITDFNRSLNNYRNLDKKITQLSALDVEFKRWINRWELFQQDFFAAAAKQEKKLSEFQLTTNKVEKKIKDICGIEHFAIEETPSAPIDEINT